MDREVVSNYLSQQKCQWTFNPPHGSHCGGVWERMIGICRKVLDSTLTTIGPTRLTHEVLCTLMAEVMAIVNNRPLVPISSDPTMPDILTPSMVLTQKPSSLKAVPGNFVRRISVGATNSGGRFNILPMSFGQDGEKSFSLFYNHDVNGKLTRGT